MQKLIDRISAREVNVGIVGLGYVGLPLGLVFCEAGLDVLGFDVDPKKIDALAKGESYIKHIGPDRIAAAVESERFTATTDFARLGECDAVLICVPTPLGRNREPDLGYVRDTADRIAATLRPGQLIVLESTTYPGTTEEEVLPRLEKTGLTTPEDFLSGHGICHSLAFRPSRYPH